MGEEHLYTELCGFLAPNMRPDVRHGALQYIFRASDALDGSAGGIFQMNDFQLGKALCVLCEAAESDRELCLAALTNYTSGSADAAGFILSNSRIVALAYYSCLLLKPYAKYGARLLANLSRHFPDRVYEQLQADDDKCQVTVAKLAADAPNDDGFLGYILVNWTTIAKHRRSLLDHDEMMKALFVLMGKGPKSKEIVADVFRNLCFDEGLHEKLLNHSDEFLVTLLQPLADSNDELDDEEMQKLPIRLQYYEGERETSPLIRQKLVEALYQLCATRHGRETLRRKGVYALLRELDRATTEKPDPQAPPPKMRPPQLLAQEEHTLHALIGVLIRYEEEMGVDSFSLKQLE